METIVEYCGCLCCLLTDWPDVHATVEHITERGRRLGHQATIGLCLYHHQGTAKPLSGTSGPSLAHGRKPFEAFFGDEVEILLPVQNYVLARFDADPWPPYNLPATIAKETRHLWKALRYANVP